MNARRETPRRTSLIIDHLIDDVMEAYDEWQAECKRVRDCYERWFDARDADAALAYAACTSALDHEQRAAEKLDETIGRLGNVQPHTLRELRQMS